SFISRARKRVSKSASESDAKSGGLTSTVVVASINKVVSFFMSFSCVQKDRGAQRAAVLPARWLLRDADLLCGARFLAGGLVAHGFRKHGHGARPAAGTDRLADLLRGKAVFTDRVVDRALCVHVHVVETAVLVGDADVLDSAALLAFGDV